MLNELTSSSLISYSFWWFYFDLSHWFCWFSLIFWSWQFDRSCQTVGVCCIKAVILTVCTVWLLPAKLPAKQATQILEPPKILDFRLIQQLTLSLLCNNIQYISQKHPLCNFSVILPFPLFYPFNLPMYK